MTHNLTPMQVVERLIGKPEQIAAVVGYKEKAAFPWRNASKNRAAGHFPSTMIMQRILTHSDAHNLGLTAQHLIWGASEAEVAQILAQRSAPAPAFASVREVAA